MHLFEIPDAIRAAVNDPSVIDHDTGEVLQPEVLATLDAEKGRIVLYLARVSVEQDAEAGAVADQAARLAKRAVAHGNRADSIRRYIAGCCEKGEKFSDDCVKVSVQESTKCEVLEEADIPRSYFVTPDPPDPKLDKAALLKALRALGEGESIKGAALKRTPFANIS